MEATQILEQVDQKMGSFGSILDAKLAEFGEKLPKPIEPDEVKSAEEAELEAKALTGITGIEVWDIPLGQAVIGGFGAVVLSELVDGFLAAQSGTVKGVVKLAMAGVTIKWGTRVIGKPASAAIALLLAYDGIRMLLPIDEWANKLATGVTGLVPGGGLAGKAGMGSPIAGVTNYYPGITQRVG